MKTIKGILIVTVTLLVLAGCQSKQEKAVELDEDLMNQLVGTWYDSSYDFNKYEIQKENNIIQFNDIQLVIDTTEENIVRTHEKEDEKSTYNFVIEESEVLVLRSYELPKDQLGGAFPPITLRKEMTLNLELLSSGWLSVEEDYPAYIEIKRDNNGNNFKVSYFESQDSEVDDEETWQVEKEDQESITMLNADKSSRLTFGIFEGDKLLMVHSVTDENSEGTARPWILERVE